MVDAHGTNPKSFQETTISTSTTQKTMRILFAVIPNEVNSDNSPQFLLAKFTQLMAPKGKRHIKPAPTIRAQTDKRNNL